MAVAARVDCTHVGLLLDAFGMKPRRLADGTAYVQT
jgi:hypothetical protein